MTAGTTIVDNTRRGQPKGENGRRLRRRTVQDVVYSDRPAEPGGACRRRRW